MSHHYNHNRVFLFLTGLVLALAAWGNALACQDSFTIASSFGRISMEEIPKKHLLFHRTQPQPRIISTPEMPAQLDTSLAYDVLSIEKTLRDRNLIYDKNVQKLLTQLHVCRSQSLRDFVIRRLLWIIAQDDLKALRQPDPFKPYGPECLLSQGNLHLLTQMDLINWHIVVDKLLTGMGIIGPQQGGKSRLIVSLCEQITRINPPITITILDPKDGFRLYAPRFRANYLNLDENSFDLCPPPGISDRDFALEFMPILADSLGLIYGLDILNEATEIALNQLQECRKKTGQDTHLCLQDIYAAIPLVKNTFGGRRSGYRDAAVTALSRVLGHKNLFACRKGIPLDWLFIQNFIINARCLTDDMQCRGLGTYLFYWKYQAARHCPETNQIKRLIIIDDASRFIGTAGNQFEAVSRTSPLGHILATLRSAGTGLCFATQLPAQVDPSVLTLTHSLLAVGGMAGQSHLNVIKSFMSLNDDQVQALTQMQTREAIGFSSGSAYPHVVHGWVPEVADPDPDVEVMPTKVNILPWHHLTEGSTPAKIIIPPRQPLPPAATSSSPQRPVATDLSPGAVKLVLEVVTFPYATISEHIARLGGSSSALEAAKPEACQKGYLLESKAGRVQYLIPTEKAFQVFQMPCPFRAAKKEHGFYAGLAEYLLKNDSQLASIKTEVALGHSSAASDLVTITKSGIMIAYEITLSTSNLMANGSKYIHTAYAKIIWLCRDDDTVQAVKGFFREADLPTELRARFDYLHFSGLVKQQRQLFKS